MKVFIIYIYTLLRLKHFFYNSIFFATTHDTTLAHCWRDWHDATLVIHTVRSWRTRWHKLLYTLPLLIYYVMWCDVDWLACVVAWSCSLLLRHSIPIHFNDEHLQLQRLASLLTLPWIPSHHSTYSTPFQDCCAAWTHHGTTLSLTTIRNLASSVPINTFHHSYATAPTQTRSHFEKTNASQ